MASISELTPGTWNIDPHHSSIGFAVRHLMINTVRGQFDEFEAKTVVGQPIEQSEIDITIQVGSINTNNGDRDGHLKSGDFFDAEQFPTITFKSTKITDSEITGDLTIKGTTKPVTLSYAFNGIAKDPWGATRAGFAATGEVNRADFGVSFNAPLETGGVLVGEKIKLELDLEFIQA